MKNGIKHILSLLAFAPLFFACEKETTPEPVRVQYPDKQSPIVRDNAYYERLRAYRKSDHSLAFGWFGSWTAVGASEQTRLAGTPDSMDIISMWSQWHSLTKQQMADKEFVQKIRGTKVVFCISAKDMPEHFKEDGVITDASIVAYAKAYGKDSMDKYQYDGIDIDFETAVDHQGPLNTTPGLFKKFCEELSKYIGPNSGTGRLFLIDGNIGSLDAGIAELCTYGVSQAYNCRGQSDLINRTTSAGYTGWRPEQLIFTENFESLWKSGGADYTLPDGETVPSLLGMAHFAKTNTAVGFGSYHMEYEYGHSDMPYKYMRQAIQLANPAPAGDYSKNLISLEQAGEEEFTITVLKNGQTNKKEYQTTLTATLSAKAPSDVDIPAKLDNSLIAAYNDYYYTEYKSVDPSGISFSGPFHFAEGSQAAEPVTMQITDLSIFELGSEYLLPIVVDYKSVKGYSANTNKEIKYLIVKKVESDSNIEAGATSVEGTVIADRTGWIYSVEGQNTDAIGGLNNSEMFDGVNNQLGWYSSVGGKRMVTVDMTKTQNVIGWRMGMVLGDAGYRTKQLFDIQTSVDGSSWESQCKGATAIGAPDANKWQYVKFYAPVKCRYIRMTYENSSDSASNNFIGSNEFNAIAPNN